MTLQTDGWTDAGYHNIPAFSSKSAGINICSVHTRVLYLICETSRWNTYNQNHCDEIMQRVQWRSEARTKKTTNMTTMDPTTDIFWAIHAISKSKFICVSYADDHAHCINRSLYRTINRSFKTRPRDEMCTQVYHICFAVFVNPLSANHNYSRRQFNIFHFIFFFQRK